MGGHLNGAGQDSSESAVWGDRNAKLLAALHPSGDQLLPEVSREGSIVGNTGCTQQHISHQQLHHPLDHNAYTKLTVCRVSRLVPPLTSLRMLLVDVTDSTTDRHHVKQGRPTEELSA